MRKRSSYRPRVVLSDPLSLLRPAPKPQRDVVMARFLTALDAMARGDHPGEAEWRDLSDAINTVETLALHIDPPKLVAAEVMPLVNDAIAAMVGAAKRFKAGQRMGVDGPGLQALREVVAVYDKCLHHLTEHEMALAQQETERRIHAILRSREPSAEVVAV